MVRRSSDRRVQMTHRSGQQTVALLSPTTTLSWLLVREVFLFFLYSFLISFFLILVKLLCIKIFLSPRVRFWTARVIKNMQQRLIYTLSKEKNTYIICFCSILMFLRSLLLIKWSEKKSWIMGSLVRSRSSVKIVVDWWKFLQIWRFTW